MARLLADENFPLPTVEDLRQCGHDVVSVQELGCIGICDESVLDLAKAHSRILLTLNRRDFINLHNKSAQHAGIIVCTFDRDFSALADRIHAAVVSQNDFKGCLLRVNRPHS